MMRLRPYFLRWYRLTVLLGIGWLLHQQMERVRLATFPTLPLVAVQEIFPTATALKPPETEHGWQEVQNAAGEKLGDALATAPVTDHLLGYAGPSNVLIGRNPAGEVEGVRLLTSADTPKHVELVVQARHFWEQFRHWDPQQHSPPTIDAVSGASLTSQAIAEAILTRLHGTSASLRFPAEITLAEAQTHFPAAAKFTALGPKFHVVDVAGNSLGYLLRTSPSADNVSGYAGPTECLVSLASDAQTVLRVTIRRSYDTESYVEQIMADPHYLKIFAGRSLATLASMDFDQEQIEGVSGSTQTSYAIAESLKRRATAVLAPAAPDKPLVSWQRVDWVLASFMLGAIILAFTPLRGNPKLRLIWQLLLVGALGLWAGQLISLALVAGWSQHGVPWRTAPGLVLLLAVTLLVPWGSRRQIYCHHLCPHGAAQSLLGQVLRRKWTVPARWHRWLKLLPAITLAAALFLLVVSTKFKFPLDLTLLEPFDAWGWRAAAAGPIVLAVLGLGASLFVPQAYCHYGCPTGALLKYLRSPGHSDHFGISDAISALLLVAVFVLR